MGKLRSAKELVGYAIEAEDGDIGEVRELYFDDATWAVRYLVVDVARWLLHKRVLLAPEVLGTPDEDKRCIPASVTRDQVRRSPRTETDKPIALQHQALLHAHYGWEFYGGAEALFGISDPSLLTPQTPVNIGGKPFDLHLRTTGVVAGHEVRALDGPAGRVEDFLFDDQNWTIRHLVVRTNDRRLVRLAPEEVTRISFEERRVFVNGSAAEVENRPAYESARRLSQTRGEAAG